MNVGVKLGWFLFFAFAVVLIWLSLGPIIREASVNITHKIGWKQAADYLDTA